MIESPQLRRLARLDPARDLDPTPSEDLLARLLAAPRRSALPTRARRCRRLLTPAIALGAVAAGVAAFVGASGRPSLDLAAQAYAATSAAPGQIVHVVATTERIETTTLGERHDAGRVEEWHRGSETHRIETFSKGGTQVVVDDVLGADGVTHETEDGSSRIVQAADPQHSAGDIAGEQAGFVEDFRQRYEKGKLDQAGDVQFAGRPARRYVVSLPGPQQAFYIDRATGEPLGYTSTRQLDIADPQGGSTPTTVRFVETVRTIEQLDPTPANLETLHPASVPSTP